MAGLTSDSEETVRPDGSASSSVILNELLCYVQYHIKRTANDNIAEVLARHFSLEEITSAKDLLKDNYGHVVGHILKERRNTQNKVKCISFSEDIVNALQELDAKSIETNFVAKNLGRLPRHDPKDLDPYAVMEMVLSLGDRLKQVEDSMGEAKAKVIMHDEGLKFVKETIKTHEVILSSQMIPRDPSYKEVVTGSFNDQLSVETGTDINRQVPSSSKQTMETLNAGVNQDTLSDIVTVEHVQVEQDADKNNINRWIEIGRRGKPVKHSSNDEKQKPRVKAQQGRRASFRQDLRDGRRQRHRVQGSRDGEVLEGAPLPKRDFFLYRVKKETNDDVIERYLHDKGIHEVELKIVSNASAKYNSYKLTVNVDCKDKVMSADLWPKGICIQKWRGKSNRIESTDVNNGSGS